VINRKNLAVQQMLLAKQTEQMEKLRIKEQEKYEREIREIRAKEEEREQQLREKRNKEKELLKNSRLEFVRRKEEVSIWDQNFVTLNVNIGA
jgi:hypothetical protein